MWQRYKVVLQVNGQFGASIPKSKEEILAMLEHRMPAHKPVGAPSIEELAEQVAEEVGADEEALPGASTFKRDGDGLYYEGRCIRGHIKDCALQVASFFPDIKAFRAKVANKVYVETEKIPVGRDRAVGTEERFIQVMTRQGPRSSIKYVDYVDSPRLVFILKVLDDGVIGEDEIRAIFEYGGVHGLGAERSQGWGRYSLVSLEAV